MVMIIAQTSGAEDHEHFGQLYGVTEIDLNRSVEVIKNHLEAAGPFTLVRVYAARPVDWDGRDNDQSEKRSVSAEAGIWYTSGRAWFDLGNEDLLDELL